MDADQLRQWIGRKEQSREIASNVPLEKLAATLDHERVQYAVGEEVPPLWHWCYFVSKPKQSGLGNDGHPLKGGFLPPIDLPRRMWAGSEIDFHRPLRVGSLIRRSSEIESVASKDGRSGRLVFVTLRHEVSDEFGMAVVERQNLVYRGAPTPGLAASASSDSSSTPTPDWQRVVRPSPELLFRYSAVTFNTHRIHYDRPYACNVEGYDGLVVHGPLIATLLLELLEKQIPGARVRDFGFKAVSPLVDTDPFVIAGKLEGDGIVQLWAKKLNGSLATTAMAKITRP